MFEGEALGLGAMYETGTIRVPKPFKVMHFVIFVSCSVWRSKVVICCSSGRTSSFRWFVHYYGIHRIRSIERQPGTDSISSCHEQLAQKISKETTGNLLLDSFREETS